MSEQASANAISASLHKFRLKYEETDPDPSFFRLWGHKRLWSKPKRTRGRTHFKKHDTYTFYAGKNVRSLLLQFYDRARTQFFCRVFVLIKKSQLNAVSGIFA